MELQILNDREALLYVTLKKDLIHKGQLYIPEGAKVLVQPTKDKPAYANLYYNARKEGGESDPRNTLCLWASLFRNSSLVMPNDLDEDGIEELMESSVVPSIVGEDVEPDGTDPYGFPSILMALGFV